MKKIGWSVDFYTAYWRFADIISEYFVVSFLCIGLISYLLGIYMPYIPCSSHCELADFGLKTIVPVFCLGAILIHLFIGNNNEKEARN